MPAISAYLMRHRIEVVRRAAAAAPPPQTSYDDWNAAAFGADQVVTTVNGRIRPLTVREEALLSEGGSTLTEARAYLPKGTSVLPGDRLRKTPTGETYEVRGVVPDPGGTDYFVFVELSRVVA